MLRPRRIYVGADLERLYADYLTHLACRAAEFGIPISSHELLFRNLDRPPRLSPLREGTVRDNPGYGAVHEHRAAASERGDLTANLLGRSPRPRSRADDALRMNWEVPI